MSIDAITLFQDIAELKRHVQTLEARLAALEDVLKLAPNLRHTCVRCDQVYLTYHKNQIYCTEECRLTAMAERAIVRRNYRKGYRP